MKRIQTLVQVDEKVAKTQPYLYHRRKKRGSGDVCYFLMVYVEHSPQKTKRRKANKTARKQRKLNNKKN